MTVAALTEGRAQIQGDGVTDRVDLDFQFVDQTNLRVIHTDAAGFDTEWVYQQSPGTWSFTGGDFASGTVHFEPTDLVSGERLTVTLVSDYTQPYSLAGGEIDPAVLERSMDRRAIDMQAVAARSQRSLSVSPSLAGALPELEVPDLPDGHTIVRDGDKLVPALVEGTAISAAVAAAQDAQAAAEQAASDANTNLDDHEADTANPHSVTATQVGLGNVENTADADKPVSTAQQAALGLKADLASPAFSGSPTLPTASQGTNTTQAASTAFVVAEIAAKIADLVDSSPGTLDTLNELAAALGDDPNFATTMTNALAAKAPIASPALTGDGSISGKFTAGQLVTTSNPAGTETDQLFSGQAVVGCAGSISTVFPEGGGTSNYYRVGSTNDAEADSGSAGFVEWYRVDEEKFRVAATHEFLHGSNTVATEGNIQAGANTTIDWTNGILTISATGTIGDNAVNIAVSGTWGGTATDAQAAFAELQSGKAALASGNTFTANQTIEGAAPALTLKQTDGVDYRAQANGNSFTLWADPDDDGTIDFEAFKVNAVTEVFEVFGNEVVHLGNPAVLKLLDLPYLSPKFFGITDLAGTTDYATEVQQMMDDAIGDQKKVMLPGGIIRIDSDITVTPNDAQKSLGIMGVAPNASRLRFYSGAGFSFNGAGTWLRQRFSDHLSEHGLPEKWYKCQRLGYAFLDLR